ncbi:MAG: hypothetical protein ACYTDT_09190 [Planctomycetota bacterium]|jgi:uncharacterized small protein (DUF1192 family)
MRWILTATCAGLLVLSVTACNQNDAALRAEIEALKAQQAQSSSGNDDKVIAAILAGQGKGGDTEALERKVNSLSEDIRAGVSDLKTELKTSTIESDAKLDSLEARMDKVTELQASIITLKTMIEALESKVKNVDPNETLEIQKDLITKEAELKAERIVTAGLQADIEAAKENTVSLEAEIAALKEQISGLEEDDVSRHPMYKKLKAELRDMKAERDVLKDDRDLWRKKHDELLDQIGKGATQPPEENPTDPTPKVYDFKGKVSVVTSGKRPSDPSNVLMSISSGTVPPLGAELLILDSENKPVCHVKVTRHFHVDDDSSMPVNQLGGTTIGEKANKPVTRGDIVAWNKPETEGNAGGN